MVRFFSSLDTGLKLTVVGVVLFSAVLGILTLTSMSVDTIEMVRTFDTDEEYSIRRLQQIIDNDSVDPKGHFVYPFFHPTLGFWIVKALSFFGFDADLEYLSGFVLRALSFLSLLAVFWIIEIILARQKVELPVRLCFQLLLISAVTFTTYSFTIHPELLQVFLFTLCLLTIYLLPSRFGILLASFFAGVAFGTKYAGFMLLPGLFFMFLARFFLVEKLEAENAKSRRFAFWPRTGSFLGFSILFGLAFLAGWLLTNPYVIAHSDVFLLKMKALFAYLVDHDSAYAKAHPTQQSWSFIIMGDFGRVSSRILLTCCSLFVAYIVLLFIRPPALSLGKSRFARIANSREDLFKVTLLVIFLTSYIQMTILMRTTASRYILQLYPMLILLAALGFNWLYAKLHRPIQVVLAWVLCGFVVYGSQPGLSTLGFYANYRSVENPYYVAGEWLLQNIPADARIMADKYLYVPHYYKNVDINWRDSRYWETAETFKPDVMMLNQASTGRWTWKEKGSKFSELKLTRPVEHELCDYFQGVYRELFGEDSEWETVYEVETVVILRRKKIPAEVEELQDSAESGAED